MRERENGCRWSGEAKNDGSGRLPGGAGELESNSPARRRCSGKLEAARGQPTADLCTSVPVECGAGDDLSTGPASRRRRRQHVQYVAADYSSAEGLRRERAAAARGSLRAAGRPAQADLLADLSRRQSFRSARVRTGRGVPDLWTNADSFNELYERGRLPDGCGSCRLDSLLPCWG